MPQASHVAVSKRGPIVCVNCDLSHAADIISAAHSTSSSTPLKESEGTLERTLLCAPAAFYCPPRSYHHLFEHTWADVLIPHCVCLRPPPRLTSRAPDVTLTVDPTLPTWCAQKDGELLIRRLDVDSVRVLSSALAQVRDMLCDHIIGPCAATPLENGWGVGLGKGSNTHKESRTPSETALCCSLLPTRCFADRGAGTLRGAG